MTGKAEHLTNPDATDDILTRWRLFRAQKHHLTVAGGMSPAVSITYRHDPHGKGDQP